MVGMAGMGEHYNLAVVDILCFAMIAFLLCSCSTMTHFINNQPTTVFEHSPEEYRAR